MIPFLIVALILAIVVIIVQAKNQHSAEQSFNARMNEQISRQIKSKTEQLQKENDRLQSALGEERNKYKALWNLKNKLVDENSDYREQIRTLSQPPLHQAPTADIPEDEKSNLIEALQKELKQLHGLLDRKNDDISYLHFINEQLQTSLDDARAELNLNNYDELNERVDEICEIIEDLQTCSFAQLPNDFKDSILSGRLARAFDTTSLSIHGAMNIEATIRSDNNFYKTSLRGCTCPDYLNRHAPCKHMLFLSYTSGLMLLNKEALSDFAISKIEDLNDEIRVNLLTAREAKKQKESALKKQKETVKLVDRLEKELDQSYPWLAGMYKRFQIEQDNHDAYLLSDRSTTSKDIVKKLKRKNSKLRYEKALYENQLIVYESLFPWLEEFKKVDIDKAVKYVSETRYDEEYDRVSDYLSPAEYKTLSSAKKNQMALDRYKRHRKSDWEIGIDYERYIGYLYESQGYKVSYTGAIDYLKDMGRDLICQKEDEILVIQCKRWSVHKKIHEKHIFQLFGSTIQFRYKNPELSYKPILYTTTKLSEVASYCAEQLGVEVVEYKKYEDYPCIKCNISKNGEKIYHLPFDQQYDRISIEADKGECYAMTAEEAENAGFRRAFKHKP